MSFGKLLRMEQYRVVVTKTAKMELFQLGHYIATELCNPVVAISITDAIIKAIDSLAAMPFRFPLVRNKRLAAKGIRFLPVENYIIFFSVKETEKIVYIQHVFHGNRNWVELLR